MQKSVLSRKHVLVLLIHKYDTYQVLPLRARVDLRAMATKGYSSFLKAPVLLEPRYQIV